MSDGSIPQLASLATELGENSRYTRQSFLHLEDLLALAQLPELDPTRYLPWTSSAMRPSCVQIILNEICLNQRRTLVECGSGISTLYICKLLSQTGGQLYSIDNDPAWQQRVREQLETYQISTDVVTFIDAPLTPCPLSPSRNSWYDMTVLESHFAEGQIDLLLVDGPIVSDLQAGDDRYPALPFFYSKLAEEFVVIMDDANRSAEQVIAQKWAATFHLDGKLARGGHLCLLYPKQSQRFNVI